MEDNLFELYYSQVHRNEELERTIEELQGALKYRKNENENLQNDLQQATNKIKLLNNQIDNLQRNVGYLCEENIKLRDTINAYEQLF